VTPIGRQKIILLDDRFPTGEPTVQPVVLWTIRGKASWEPLSKEASASPALDYIRSVQPIPGRTIVLVIGLGSYEWYGLNRNGDGFNEQPYKVGVKPTCGCCGKGRDAWVQEDELVQRHFQSYEEGNVFRHHVNKDPAKRIGKILKAFWNPYMHRVEVLEDIENDKAPDLVEQIGDGEFPAKSMGCRIRFDVCTKCGHQAPTRKHYCDHLKWMLGQLDPTGSGIRFGALNPAPRFFDSSWVFRPADRCGFMLKKVATAYDVQSFNSSALGDLVDDLNSKAAAVKKLAVIDKVIRGYPAAVVQSDLPEAGLIQQYRDQSLPSVVENTPPLGTKDIQSLAGHPLPDTLAALSRAGILLTTPEFVRLFVEKALPGVQLPDEVLENLTALQPELFEVFSKHPSMLNDLTNTLATERPQQSEQLQQIIEPLREKRSTVANYLRRRLVPGFWRQEDRPKTDVLEVQDPTSGRSFITTRGAADAAEDELAKSKLLRTVGSAALLGGAYKMMKSLPGRWKLLGVPTAASGLIAGKGIFEPDAMYQTTTGEQVPYLTEFQEKQSSLLDFINTLGMDYGITREGTTKLARVTARLHDAQPLQYFMRKLSSFGLYHPELSLERLVESDKFASDGITEERISLEKLAEVIGALVWNLP
jgi:hypothetical protein